MKQILQTLRYGERRLLYLTLMLQLDTWRHQVRTLWLSVTRVLASLAARVSQSVPRINNEHIGFVWAWAIPIILYSPLFLNITIPGFYTEVKYLWLTAGPKIHSAIAITMLYLYRKTEHLKILTFYTAGWFALMGVLDVVCQSNGMVFTNYIVAMCIYTIVVFTLKIISKK